tara:strand:- start:1519 stop:1731 length:213 start_codon:yes stop_codon:yes gene_type:complete
MRRASIPLFRIEKSNGYVLIILWVIYMLSDTLVTVKRSGNKIASIMGVRIMCAPLVVSRKTKIPIRKSTI